MATGQVLGEDASALAVLREAVKRSDFRRKRRAWRGTNRGIGLSLFFHGAGFTGSGEVMLASRAALELVPRGVRILVGQHRDGPGHAHDARADRGRDAGPAARARRGGDARHRARARQRPDRRLAHLHGRGRPPEGVRGGDEGAARRPLAGGVPEAARPAARSRGSTSRRRGSLWDDATYRGDAYATYGWGCDVVEVELDPVTYEVRPTRVTAVVEIGRAINPLMVAGQIEGGTAQGLGYALLEEVVMRDGRMANAQLTNYLDPDDARHAADRRHDPREPVPRTGPSGPRASARCR